jgi:signal transduction histidine kinase
LSLDGIGASPLQWLLEQDYALLQRDAASCGVWLDMKWEGWLQKMEKDYPGLFCTDRAYAFPVWCVYDHSPEPLGIVVVDMPYTNDEREKERVAATGLVIDLAADILASRKHERRQRAWLGRLSDIVHPVKGLDHFSTVWNAFTQSADAIFEKATGSLAFQDPDDAELLEEARADLEQIKPAVQSYLRAQEAASQRITGPDGPNHIKDLGEYLDDIARHYRDFPAYQGYLTFEGEWGDVRKMPLPCEKEIFRDVLHFLVQNAVEAARGKFSPSVNVTVTALRRDLPTGCTLDSVVTLRVADTGPGISPHIKNPEDIFLSGFSQQEEDPATSAVPQPRIKGKGLALARSLLYSCHGDLRLIDSRLREEGSGTLVPVERKGATFEIVFGIPRPRSEPTGGKTNEQGIGSGRRRPAQAGDRADRQESRL